MRLVGQFCWGKFTLRGHLACALLKVEWMLRFGNEGSSWAEAQSQGGQGLCEEEKEAVGRVYDFLLPCNKLPHT